ncbi:hypothetical protein NDU88_004230 [Pleurodeles waltl]|uniref:Uncharacterized protein n=1 Tax=Pleurodeles waltl TaxID=8319 RepID=A0AAV7UGA5_PLEWA|nr:hypothetical protein NDU88_004230 [Pleurodeles waltl]
MVQDSRLCCIREFENKLTSFRAWTCPTPYLVLGPTAQTRTPAGTEAFIPHCRIHLRIASECDGTQVFNVVGYQLQAVSHTGPLQARTATPSSSSAGSKPGHAAGRALGDWALSSTNWAHELPARLGATDTRLCKGRLPRDAPAALHRRRPPRGRFSVPARRDWQLRPPGRSAPRWVCAPVSARATNEPQQQLGPIFGVPGD